MSLVPERICHILVLPSFILELEFLYLEVTSLISEGRILEPSRIIPEPYLTELARSLCPEVPSLGLERQPGRTPEPCLVLVLAALALSLRI